MSQNYIWQKIVHELADEITSEDKAAIDQWCSENRHNNSTYHILTEVWRSNPKHEHDTSGIYLKFKQRQNLYLKRQSIPSRLLYYSIRIAAILFLLVSFSIIMSEFVFTGKRKEIAYQEIFIPKGNRTSFTLPDGTKVWLSNNSTLRFPDKFNKQTRELELAGEAYFEVTHDKKRPFIVNIGENRIRVLGTKFSVMAYPNDNIVKSELISGKVILDIYSGTGKTGYRSYEIKPTHGLTLDKTTGKIIESKIAEGFYNYWQNGVYEFNNESLESLSVKINRIFNVQIVFEDESLKSRRFSGTVEINDNIFTFLEAIKRTSLVPFEYYYKEGSIYVKHKK
jgi:transmembrane sensor